jgi:hypothetical protein
MGGGVGMRGTAHYHQMTICTDQGTGGAMVITMVPTRNWQVAVHG